jgi:hypothetical protein
LTKNPIVTALRAQKIQSLNTNSIRRNNKSGYEKIFIPDSSAGLARSHRLIRIEKEKEIIFLKLCSQIRFDDFKQKRSEHQREERKLKRIDKFCDTTID